MVRFDKFQQHEQEAPISTVPPTPDPGPKTNGATSHPTTTKREPSSPPPKRKATSSPSEADPDDDLSSVIDSPPPAKKVKKAKSHTETDEEIAKRMQAELNAQSARSTRGGGTKRKPAAKKSQNKTPKKKSKAKINSDDDSDVEGSDKPEKERKGGFHVSTPKPIHHLNHANEDDRNKWPFPHPSQLLSVNPHSHARRLSNASGLM